MTRLTANSVASNASLPVLPYEQQLSQGLDSAMNEASLYFEGKGKVYATFDRITRRLEELNIDYAVCGGLALFAHGYRRFTEDVDILVTPDGLKRVHEKLDGLGFVRPFVQSKNLRDAQTGVRIEFLVTGQYPGDGKPKEVAFPDPADASEIIDGRRILSLSRLIELKLASGLTGAGREKDLGDVSALIQGLKLPQELDQRLHPYVREKYRSLWDSVNAPRRFVRAYPRDADPAELNKLQLAGITVDDTKSTTQYYYLVATDEHLADQYEMVPEDEFYF